MRVELFNIYCTLAFFVCLLLALRWWVVASACFYLFVVFLKSEAFIVVVTSWLFPDVLSCFCCCVCPPPPPVPRLAFENVEVLISCLFYFVLGNILHFYGCLLSSVHVHGHAMLSVMFVNNISRSGVAVFHVVASYAANLLTYVSPLLPVVPNAFISIGNPAEGRGDGGWSQRDAHKRVRRAIGAGHQAASFVRFQPYSLIRLFVCSREEGGKGGRGRG